MKSTSLVIALFLTFAVSTAFAEHHGAAPNEAQVDHDAKHHKKMMKKMAKKAKKRMKRIDTNGDGVVDREEYMKHHADRFAELDSNDDGAVSFEEMEAAQAKMRKKHNKKMKKHKKKQHDDEMKKHQHDEECGDDCSIEE